MPRTTRRQFLILAATAAAGTRLVPGLAARAGGRRLLTLVYDKAAGGMRAIDRLLP